VAHLQEIEQVSYPPAPWHFTGQAWIGLFRSAVSRPLPDGLKHILDPHLFIVSVVRYLDGTLRYDELFFSTPAWFGIRPGLHVDEIWVDNRSSLWGGRRIWGLPKKLAHFTWDDSTLSVADDLGPIAKIALDLHPAHFPWLWVTSPAFGHREHSWFYFWSSIWGRFDLSAMQIDTWSDRYPRLACKKPIFSFGAKPFRIRISAPSLVTTEG
jgi:hypothetical protein